MRPLRILAAFIILAGAALLAYSVATGEMQVALVLIVPVVYGSSAMGILAIGLVIAGVFIFMVDPFLDANAEDAERDPAEETAQPGITKKPEFGGVVLIGPIPIIFGSSKGMTLFAIVVAVIILAIMVLSLFYSGG